MLFTWLGYHTYFKAFLQLKRPFIGWVFFMSIIIMDNFISCILFHLELFLFGDLLYEYLMLYHALLIHEDCLYQRDIFLSLWYDIIIGMIFLFGIYIYIILIDFHFNFHLVNAFISWDNMFICHKRIFIDLETCMLLNSPMHFISILYNWLREVYYDR
jgi:hypothetical protein